MEKIMFEELDSTHKFLKEKYKEYSDETVIIANRQTAGIGTHGRSWFTGSSKNIAMSILYKTNLEIQNLEGLTTNIAQIIQKILKDIYNINLKIKMPNDLLLNNKKICGILTEINTLGNEINYLIISVGFNVNEDEFPEEIQNIATSLKNEYKKDFDKEKLINEFLKKIEEIVNNKYRK